MQHFARATECGSFHASVADGEHCGFLGQHEEDFVTDFRLDTRGEAQPVHTKLEVGVDLEFEVERRAERTEVECDLRQSAVCQPVARREVHLANGTSEIASAPELAHDRRQGRVLLSTEQCVAALLPAADPQRATLVCVRVRPQP